MKKKIAWSDTKEYHQEYYRKNKRSDREAQKRWKKLISLKF